MECMLPKVKKEDNSYETYDGGITPTRIQKVSLSNFRNMDFQFLKSIQPGIIQSNGVFKKINQSQKDLPFENEAVQSGDAVEVKE